MADRPPRLAVLSVLFPHPGQPNAGLFIRERMFRVGERLPLFVVAPQPWFPFQGLIRRFRPHFRPPAPAHEHQQGFEVYHPRFFSVPGRLKSLDGFFLALGCLGLLRRLRDRFDIIDAHFAYPDGYAATLLGRWLGVPVTITLRGTEVPLARDPRRRRLMVRALARARRVFAVADALKRHVVGLGADGTKITVVGNGVDHEKFRPADRTEARRRLGIPEGAPVLVTVGGLVERKGFHRVIELLPELSAAFPGLRYLVVGGPSPEGDMTAALKDQAARLGVAEHVIFTGPLPAAALRWPLSAADVFVLSTRNEGWANVFLEAMACGLPVVTTDVGGNREVVSAPWLGRVVPFGDAAALAGALREALAARWDRARIRRHAEDNSWETRVEVLVDVFEAVLDERGMGETGGASARAGRS